MICLIWCISGCISVKQKIAKFPNDHEYKDAIYYVFDKYSLEESTVVPIVKCDRVRDISVICLCQD